MGHTYGRRRALLKRMQRGFTMVEVIVAIGMLTLVGLAAAQFAITAVHSSYAHQQRAIAVGLAESGMEQVQESVKGKKATRFSLHSRRACPSRGRRRRSRRLPISM